MSRKEIAMKEGFTLTWMLLVLLVAAAWLTACAGTPPSRFYTLSPLQQEAKESSGNPGRPVVIDIEPVEVPDYLNRPQIVTREGLNEVKLAEVDRWAGSLGDNISTVLAENLSLLLGTDRVFVNPGVPLEKADYVVALRVIRLDLLPGDRVLFKAQWNVRPLVAGKVGATRVSSVTEKLTDNRYETMVAGVNRALGQVSREIAGEIPLQVKGEAPLEAPAK